MPEAGEGTGLARPAANGAGPCCRGLFTRRFPGCLLLRSFLRCFFCRFFSGWFFRGFLCRFLLRRLLLCRLFLGGRLLCRRLLWGPALAAATPPWCYGRRWFHRFPRWPHRNLVVFLYANRLFFLHFL